MLKNIVILASLTCVMACSSVIESKQEWIQLFNGKDLDGWTPKVTGYALGENPWNVFRVEEGVLKASYDDFDQEFTGQFGHLFYKEVFSSYRLRVEYRFVGEQVSGGPDWAYRNNGVMIHGQSAESMNLDDKFPRSIEIQMLGGNGTDTRSTGNICTPETQVVINGELVTDHVINSSSKTYHGEQWVTLEVEVRGGEVIRHYVNGELVMEYTDPQLDSGVILDKGTISIQAESHPTEFRKIELLPLFELNTERMITQSRKEREE